MSRQHETPQNNPRLTLSTEYFIPVETVTILTPLAPATPADRVKIPAGKRRASNKKPEKLIESDQLLGIDSRPHHSRR
ncbi:MAG TPA: hypothetical protein VLG38_03570 [Gammaproteobacteria bacterium]|nr:hypothetical protein [Gammaproteobacteria bacterium]